MRKGEGRGTGGWTMVELLVSAMILTMAGTVVAMLASTAVRLSARNLSSNLGHDTIRRTMQRVTNALDESVTPYGLVSWDGATITDVNESKSGSFKLTNTGVQDQASKFYVSSAANGVKYRRMVGPGRLVSDLAAGSSTAVVAMPVESSQEVPNTNDLLYIPLLEQTNGQTFAISSVTTGSTSGGMRNYTLGLATPSTSSVKLGADEAGTTGTISAYLLKRSVFAVRNGALYHFPTVSNTNSVLAYGPEAVLIRQNLATEKPFSLLYRASGSFGTVDNTMLRTLLQSYDTRSQRTESTSQQSSVVTVSIPRYVVSYSIQ